MNESLLTIKEAARLLKVHWQTVRTYIEKNKLKALRFGKNIRISLQDIDNLLKENKLSEPKSYELEIRFLIKNRQKIEKKLLVAGARVTDHIHVIDHWFVHNHIKSIKEKNEDFNSGKGFGLRIREQDNGYTGKVITTLEVKRLLIPFKHDTCVEREIDVENYSETTKLLKLMNYKEFIAIDKDRLVYKLGKYKIVIDDIKNFGIAVELEVRAKSRSKRQLDSLYEIAKLIGLDIQSENTSFSATYEAMLKFSKF